MITRGTPSVRFFLSRALCPRVQANGRWIGINATKRNAFSITGKEPGSPFLAYLASGSSSSERSFESARKQLGVDECLDVKNYLGWYRVLNHGYPFLDYAKEGTMAADTDLMKGYAAVDPAPPLVTSHTGERLKLVEGRLKAAPLHPEFPSEPLIAGWLRIAAGFTGVRKLSHSQATFRTSPSGGARHPTDLGICLTGDWPANVRGSWWYDGVSHELTRTKNLSPALS